MTEKYIGSYLSESRFNLMDEPAKEALSSQEKDIPVLISPIRPDNNPTSHPVDFEPFNPRVISKEQFDQVPGRVQEFALKYLIRTGDSESIKRLKDDFEMDKPLSNYEIAVTDAIDKITQRTEPIEPNQSDTQFSFINTFVMKTPPRNPDGEFLNEAGFRNFRQAEASELARKLEAERLRRQELRTQGNEDLFYSWEWIGNYAPARRYRRLLEVQVEREKEEERVAQMKKVETAKVSEIIPHLSQDAAEIKADLKLIKTAA